MKEVIPTIDELIIQLEKTGRHKEARDLSQVKKAISGVGRRPGLPRAVPEKEPTEVVPSQESLKKPFARKGEFVVEIDPKTGEEKYIMYGIERPFSIDELEEHIKSGRMTTQWLLDQYNAAKTPKWKGFFGDLIKKQQEQTKKVAACLCEASATLSKSGYDTLSHRVHKIANRSFG